MRRMPALAHNEGEGEAMSEQPIHVRVEVGEHVGELTIVGDAADAMLAYKIGQAVSVSILELGGKP